MDHDSYYDSEASNASDNFCLGTQTDDGKRRRSSGNSLRSKRNNLPHHKEMSRRRVFGRENEHRSGVFHVQRSRRRVIRQNVDPQDSPWQGFYFKPRREKLDWRSISHIDIDLLMDNVDIDTLESITRNLTFSKVEAKDLRYFTEESFVHLFQLCQLIMEYLLYVQGFLAEKRSSMEADVESVLEELDHLREEIRKKESQNRALRREIKRYKRTIFAYQIVFGADPEKAKMMLSSMHAGIVPPFYAASTPAPASRTDSERHLGEIMSDMKRMRDDIHSIQSRMRYDELMLDVVEKKKDELQKQHEKRLIEMQAEFEKLVSSVKQAQTTPKPGQASDSAPQNIQDWTLRSTTEEIIREKTEEFMRRSRASLQERDSKLLQYIDAKVKEAQAQWSNASKSSRQELALLREQIQSTLRSISLSQDRRPPPPPSPSISSVESDESDSVSLVSVESEPRDQVVQHVEVVPAFIETVVEREEPEESTPSEHNSTVENNLELLTDSISTITEEIRPPLTVQNFNTEIVHRVNAKRLLEEYDPHTVFHPFPNMREIKSKIDHDEDAIAVKRKIVDINLDEELAAQGLSPSARGMSRGDFERRMAQIEKQQAKDPELKQMTDKLRDLVNEIARSHFPEMEPRPAPNNIREPKPTRVKKPARQETTPSPRIRPTERLQRQRDLRRMKREQKKEEEEETPKPREPKRKESPEHKNPTRSIWITSGERNIQALTAEMARDRHDGRSRLGGSKDSGMSGGGRWLDLIGDVQKNETKHEGPKHNSRGTSPQKRLTNTVQKFQLEKAGDNTGNDSTGGNRRRGEKRQDVNHSSDEQHENETKNNNSRSNKDKPTNRGGSNILEGPVDIAELNDLMTADASSDSDVVQPELKQANNTSVTVTAASTPTADASGNITNRSLGDLDREIEKLDASLLPELGAAPARGKTEPATERTEPAIRRDAELDRLIDSIQNQSVSPFQTQQGRQQQQELDDDLSSIVSLASKKSSDESPRKPSVVSKSMKRPVREERLNVKPFDYDDFDFEDFSLGDD